jgi:RND family efflux transporter MFP subunit
MMRTLFIPALVVAASVLAAIALMATSPVLSPASPKAVLPSIGVQTARAEQVRLVVNSQGSIVPRTESDLVPEVSGRVVWMSPALISGGYFQEGETLLELDKADYQVSLKRASANLKRAQAEQEHAYFEYERLKSLEARQLVSISQLENALRVSRIAAATLEEAQVSHDQANLDLSRTTMVAPYAGFVRSKSVDIGQFVGRGSKVARVFSSESIEVRLPIADQQLAYLGLSSTSNRGRLPDELQLDVELSADYAGLNLVWQGKIVRFEAEIDAKSRMLNAVARVTSQGPQDMLTVGMFVHAEIKGVVKQNIYVLPRTALRGNNEVLLVDKDGRLTARIVEVLRVFQNRVYISAGLQDGDEVNISSLNTFIDGMYVSPIPAGELPGA